MSIKLIAFDVDGTFVGDDHLTINEKNIEAMKKAHEHKQFHRKKLMMSDALIIWCYQMVQL